MNTESCPSGRRCSTRNAVCLTAPRVRIPNSPPMPQSLMYQGVAAFSITFSQHPDLTFFEGEFSPKFSPKSTRCCVRSPLTLLCRARKAWRMRSKSWRNSQDERRYLPLLKKSLWPNHSWICFIWTPFASSILAQLWRRSWNLISRKLFSTRRTLKCLVT